MADPTVIANGATYQGLIPRRLRSILWRGFVDLANDTEALDELVPDLDELNEPWQARANAEARRIILGVVRPIDAEQQLQIGASLPLGEVQGPYISVVCVNGADNAQVLTVTDWAHSTSQVLGRPVATDSDGDTEEWEPGSVAPNNAVSVKFAPIVTRRVTAVGATEQVEIGIWHPLTEVAEVLDAAVKRILDLRKHELDAQGDLSVDLSWGGVQPDRRMYPRIAWVPMIRATVRYMRRHSERIGPRPGGVRISSKFSNG